jgi:hypothetical protein
LLLGSRPGQEPPPGAASVKEIYASGALAGYAVAIHAEAGDCRSWYWYERQGSTTYADGLGISACVGCHSSAPSAGLTPDHCVYTRAP